jgi:hypothetical protein
LDWSCDLEDTCYPSVVLRDSEGMGIGGVQVSVTLVHQFGADGSFSESTVQVTTNNDESSYWPIGFARFDNLKVNLDVIEGCPTGYFSLHFTAPGAETLGTGTFSVSCSDE